MLAVIRIIARLLLARLGLEETGHCFFKFQGIKGHWLGGWCLRLGRFVQCQFRFAPLCKILAGVRAPSVFICLQTHVQSRNQSNFTVPLDSFARTLRIGRSSRRIRGGVAKLEYASSLRPDSYKGLRVQVPSPPSRTTRFAYGQILHRRTACPTDFL